MFAQRFGIRGSEPGPAPVLPLEFGRVDGKCAATVGLAEQVDRVDVLQRQRRGGTLRKDAADLQDAEDRRSRDRGSRASCILTSQVTICPSLGPRRAR